MPPVVSIVGKSKSGKTTLVEKLIKELKSRGYLVATIKHTPQDVGLDIPGKDTWRHIQAGSETTVLASPDKVVVIKPVAQELTLDEIVRFLGEGYDIVLAEGFKAGNAPKIEVHRKEIGPPLKNIKKLIAVVTDEALETGVRQFSLEDAGGVADLLEMGFIKPQAARISLYVNNVPLMLASFPRKITRSTLLAMVSSFKGVGDIRTLEIFLKDG